MKPEAAQLFALFAGQQQPEMERLGEIPEAHHLDSRPITLPIADNKTIADEIARLHKPQFRGRPHE